MIDNNQVTISKEGQRIQEALKSGDFTNEERLRKMFRLLPSDPRCCLCNAPFSGVGGSFVKWAFNKAPFELQSTNLQYLL